VEHIQEENQQGTTTPLQGDIGKDGAKKGHL
jgi:hypothetical protein